MNELLILIISGVVMFFATIIGSFSGGGSSLIIFPTLLSFVPGTYISLLIISKLSASIMTFISGNIHFKKSRPNLKLLSVFVVFGLFGTALGTYFLQYQFNEVLFKGILTFIIFSIAIYLFFSKDTGVVKREKRKLTFCVLMITGIYSFLFNVLNGMFGGTGLFITSYSVAFLGMTFIESMSYTMITYAILSAVQVIYLACTETFNWKLALVAVIVSLFGGIVGTKLQYLKGNLWVKRAAIFAMIAVGIGMLL